MSKFKKSLAAVLAALASGVTISSAFAGEVRVPVTGKSTEQLHADLVQAASKACWADLRGEALAGYVYPECVRKSVARAVEQIGDAKLTAYAATVPAGSYRMAAR